ncbi:MAG: hypothetical protein ABIF19_17245 [Planctomycetota bacterium]
MKRLRSGTFARMGLASLMVALLASPVSAYPPDPDNAALLYYQGFLALAQLDEGARDRIANVAKGEAVPDDKVRADLSNCSGAIDFAEAAAQVPTCHWGVRYSQGFDALMPQLAQARFLTYVLIADAHIRAADGDYKGALERCLMTDTFAHHIGDDTFISYLVSLSVRKLTYGCMQDVIGQAAGDAELLQWLKNELVTIPGNDLSPVRPLKIEIEIVTDLMQMKNIGKLAMILANSDDENIIAEIVKKADAKTLEQARRLYSERMKGSLIAFSTPAVYEQAYSQLSKLTSDLDPNDPSAAAVRAFVPSLSRILTLKTRAEAHANAIKAAIEVLLSRAKTGRLPDALPSGLPKDALSGNDFEYQKTAEGFVLRCRGKDLDKDEIPQHEFKVKK